jgi:hypothetical protein
MATGPTVDVGAVASLHHDTTATAAGAHGGASRDVNLSAVADVALAYGKRNVATMTPRRSARGERKHARGALASGSGLKRNGTALSKETGVGSVNSDFSGRSELGNARQKLHTASCSQRGVRVGAQAANHANSTTGARISSADLERDATSAALHCGSTLERNHA